MADLIASLDRLEARFEELTEQLSDPKVLGNPGELRRVAKERSDLEGTVGKLREYRKVVADLRGAEEVVMSSVDPELAEMARNEVDDLRARIALLEEELKALAVPRDPNDAKNAIIEIRAGTGGEEAALFAGNVFRMYNKFAESKGYRVEILNTSEASAGGLKEIIFNVEGPGAYGAFKFESGVHRVQRVPETEASGRIHTSAVTVAVLTEVEDIEIELKEKDLKVDVFRSSGPGGQSVNTTDSAVRVTHLPTGIVVQCQDERSQLKNKAKALKVLRARLYDNQRKEQEEKLAQTRKSMVSSGDRSAKIRTYNFPQGRVTDHRIGLTLHRLQDILNGDLGEVVEALSRADVAEKIEGPREGEK